MIRTKSKKLPPFPVSRAFLVQASLSDYITHSRSNLSVSSAYADEHRYGVVEQFVGHGVGRVFHSDPVILHYRNNERGRMMLNQTFTIEPMLTMGSIHPIMWDDNWTVVTEDGGLSAQFEHTLLITENGAEILTQC